MPKTQDYRDTKSFKAFDTLLQEKTGNDFESYEELFPAIAQGIDSLPGDSDNRPGDSDDVSTPEKKVDAFIKLFGLEEIKPDMDVFDSNKISTTNRYKANLFQYPHDIGASGLWFMDNNGGIIRMVENNEAIQRISIDNPTTPDDLGGEVGGFPDFVLSQGAVEAINGEVFNVGDNRFMPIDVSQFKEVSRGPDIACIYEDMNPGISLKMKLPEESTSQEVSKTTSKTLSGPSL